MFKINPIILVISLMAFVILGLLVSLPEFIPSLIFVQFIIVLLIYLIIIPLTYVMILLMRNFIFQKYLAKKANILFNICSTLIISFILGTFLLVSIHIGDGFYNRTLAKELDFPARHVKLYIYDCSLNAPLTAIKVKDMVWPVMHDVAFFEDHLPSELRTSRNKDTLRIIGKNIELIFNLKTRKSTKKYKYKN